MIAAAPETADEADCAMACLLSGEACDAPLASGFLHLSVPLRHRFARLLGLFGEGAMPAKPGQQADLHHLHATRRFVIGTARLLYGWPAQFDERLLAIRQGTQASPSLKGTYGVLYRVLYTELSDPAFQFVRDAFEDHLHRHWWGMVCRRNRLLKPETVERHPRLSLQHAARAAMVGESVVRHLVQGQQVHADAVSLRSGRRTATVHENAVAPLAELVASAATLAGASHHAALPEGRLRQLIKAGLIHPLVSRPNQRAASWLIAKADLDRLCVKVLRSDGAPTISIRDALKYWRLHEQEAMGLLAAVIEGRLYAQAAAECCMPVGLACVVRQELKHWLSSFRAACGNAMSIDEASGLLGVKQQVAYELVERGLLKASGGGDNGRKVRPSDLAAFDRDFVSLACLAKAANRSPKALLGELETRPVTGPCVDGARQYFYRRAEVEAELVVPKSPAGLASRIQPMTAYLE